MRPPASWMRSDTARTSGAEPTIDEAADNATSRVVGVISSSYCQAGMSHVSISTSAHRTCAP